MVFECVHFVTKEGKMGKSMQFVLTSDVRTSKV